MMERRTRYWMVWNAGHPISSARHRHLSRASAESEAERLAAQSPGQEFVVLKAISSVSATRPDPKFRWAGFEKSRELDDGIPF